MWVGGREGGRGQKATSGDPAFVNGKLNSSGRGAGQLSPNEDGFGARVFVKCLSVSAIKEIGLNSDLVRHYQEFRMTALETRSSYVLHA